jgi:hypothetical protein
MPTLSMLNLNPLLNFSHTHCISICAILVPANLLATLQTLLLVGFCRPRGQVQRMTGIASLCALLMVLHVVSWLVIGVVMVPTYVLLGLGSTCLGINVWAIAQPSSLERLLNQVGKGIKQALLQRLNDSGIIHKSHHTLLKM